MKFLFPLIAILLPFTIFAQSNYRPGYVIQSNGDTLKGYINYREWDQSPKSIEFKNSTADRQAKEFTSQTARKVQINGIETYVAYAGPLSTGSVSLENLPDHIDTAKKIMSVFMKQVATGKYLTLYAQIDGLKPRYLIGEGDATPIELKYYMYFTGGEINHSDIYKGQLSLHISKFMPVNDQLSKQIDDAKYELRDLEPIINKVNGQAVPTNKKSAIRFFAGLAANSTKTKVNNVNNINSPQSSTDVTPKISAGLDIFGNAEIQKVIFRAELSFTYTQPHYHFSADPGFSIPSTTVVDYKFKQTTVSITPQVIYNVYNTGNVKVYLDGGISFNLSGYTGQVVDATNTNTYGTVLHNNTKDPYKLGGFWPSFPLQAGVVFNSHIEAYLSFITGPALNVKPIALNFTTEDVSMQSINVGVKYLFK